MQICYGKNYDKNQKNRESKECQPQTQDTVQESHNGTQGVEEEQEGDHKRWEDDIGQIAGITWGRVAIEKPEWRRLEEAFDTW
ncbi:hypothetical protein EVAR_43333_1 [Eumeta japonica]|uniref:Uncharacterized protein n=1 Tax=Eumeta variegata TaxID=151549 RepID=A0A4C1WSF1_EUMVA|nr:hypothetical protein EVAR_43333_1 [Eumeta japonica]